MKATSLNSEERKSKPNALRNHLAQGADQAKAGKFVDDFSMDALIKDMDSEMPKNRQSLGLSVLSMRESRNENWSALSSKTTRKK